MPQMAQIGWLPRIRGRRWCIETQKPVWRPTPLFVTGRSAPFPPVPQRVTRRRRAAKRILRAFVRVCGGWRRCWFQLVVRRCKQLHARAVANMAYARRLSGLRLRCGREDR